MLPFSAKERGGPVLSATADPSSGGKASTRSLDGPADALLREIGPGMLFFETRG